MGFRTTVFPRQTKGDHRRAGRMPAGEIRRNRPPAPTCSPTSPREVPCLPNSSLRPMPPSKRLQMTRKPCLTSISVLRASQGHHTLCASSSGPWFGPPARTAGLNLAPTSPFSLCRAVYDRCRVFDHVGPLPYPEQPLSRPHVKRGMASKFRDKDPSPSPTRTATGSP